MNCWKKRSKNNCISGDFTFYITVAARQCWKSYSENFEKMSMKTSVVVYFLVTLHHGWFFGIFSCILEQLSKRASLDGCFWNYLWKPSWPFSVLRKQSPGSVRIVVLTGWLAFFDYTLPQIVSCENFLKTKNEASLAVVKKHHLPRREIRIKNVNSLSC